MADSLNNWINSASFLNSTHFWVGESNGHIFETRDGGSQWQDIRSKF